MQQSAPNLSWPLALYTQIYLHKENLRERLFFFTFDLKITFQISFLKMSECQTKAGNQECFETLTLSHSNSLNLIVSLSQSLIHSLWTC